MEGDFSWLWRNVELSDFILVIREVHSAHPDAAEDVPAAEPADALEQGIQTRSGKRRRVNAAAADTAGPSTRRRAAQQQQQTPPAAAGPSSNGHDPSQHQQPAEQHQQQLDNVQGAAAVAAAAAAAQPSAGRNTRRGSHQRQQLQDSQQQQQQQQQEQPMQQQAAGQQAQHAAPVGRRTRRSIAAQTAVQTVQQQLEQELLDMAAAAEEAAAGSQPPGNAAAAAAAAAGGGLNADADAPPTGRKARSSRGKKRSADTTTAGLASARSRGAQAQEQQQEQRQQTQQQQQQQRQSDAGEGPATRRSQRRQQAMHSLQQSMQLLTTASDGGHQEPGSTEQQEPNPQQQQQAAGAAAAPAAAVGMEIRVPVHAVVLAGFSEYFKALICSWSGNLNRVLTLDVAEDEGNAALLMVEFMYTGKLPDASPEELLKMIRLADQYQVTRFMAAASSSFESLPLSTITQGVMLEVFRLSQLMLEAPEMSRVLAKARSKLLDLYGDLEKVWGCESLRDEFLALPFPAVRCLLGSELTAVAAENTALVALTGWVEEGTHGRSTTAAQRKELLGLVRLPFLTSSFVGDILHAVPWIRDALDNRQLLNAFQFAISSESTRQRLATYDYGPSSVTPHFRCPRPTSSVSRASFEWSIELSTIKRMVADAKLWGRVVELSSPLHYFAGFWWQLLFNVEKTPTPPDAPPDVAAAASSTVVEFVGVRCHVNCGSHDYWPRVVRFKATIAALQTGFWEMDYAYMKAIEGPIVDGVGLGYPGFFALPGQALESEAAWSRFARGGRVQLRCEVTDCE